MNLYTEKNTAYFTNIRFDLIKLLPSNSESKILELGSGGGDTLIEIKKRKLAKEVTGIELMEMPNSNQSNQLIDKFIITNIEAGELLLPELYYDAILIGDVLEHLGDPWKTIDQLSKYLKKGGIFIVSIPNMRFYGAMLRIFVKGDFGYEKQGLFDKTHLRFFCKKNIRQMFTTSSLKPQSITSIEKVRGDKPSFKTIFNKLTLGAFEQFLTFQYITVAEKL